MHKQNNIAPSEELNRFVELLVVDKKLGNLEPEVLEEIKKDLYSRVEDHINAGILANLSSDKLPEFEKLLENGTPEQLTEFCRSHIDDLDSVIATVLVNFRNSYLGI